MYQENHKEQQGNDRFQQLIESYKKNGYDPKYELEMNNQFRLHNGTHRLACNFVFGIEKINVKVLCRKIGTFYEEDGWQRYLSMGLPDHIISETIDAYHTIQNELIDRGWCFAAFIPNKGNLEQATREILSISYLCKQDKVEGGILVRFALNEPSYTVKRGSVVSQTATRLQMMFDSAFGENIVEVSLNCLDGHRICGRYLGK